MVITLYSDFLNNIRQKYIDFKNLYDLILYNYTISLKNMQAINKYISNFSSH